MTYPRIIGLTGFKGAGKSTAAHVLNVYHDYEETSFAEPIKVMLKALMSFQGAKLEDLTRYMYGDLKDEPCKYFLDRTPRWAMQTLGTEWGRNLMDSEIWTKSWKQSIKDKQRVSVDDVRFPNEVKLIKQLNGIIIRIDRPGYTEGVHPSEKYQRQLKYDHIIINYGTQAELTTKINSLISRLTLGEGENDM